MKKISIFCLLLLSGCADDVFERRLSRIEKLEDELLIREIKITEKEHKVVSDSINKYNSYKTHFIIKDVNGNSHSFHVSN